MPLRQYGDPKDVTHFNHRFNNTRRSISEAALERCHHMYYDLRNASYAIGIRDGLFRGHNEKT